MRHLSLAMYALGLLLVYQIYRPESAAFALATQIFMLGALASWWLPERFRLQSMLAVSLLGLFILFPVKEALLLLALSVTTIAVCRAPISLLPKCVTLVVIAAAVLLWRRFDPDQSMTGIVVPTFGAIFMLRTAFYIKAVQRNPALRGWKEALSFFLLLPNFALWFFPLIDFKKFTASAEAKRDNKVLQSGLDWIVEGTMQLILYRVLQVTLHMPLERVNTYGEFFQYLILNLLTYIRVSGAFHVVVGLICLFGVYLPRTHTYYLFCNSPAELARRVNSYWKDFMEIIVFRPVFAKTKNWGRAFSLVAAVLAVFWASCLLHSYVAFWTKGYFAVRPQDILFWTLAGVFLALDTYLMRRWNGLAASSRGPFWFLVARITYTQVLLATFFAIWSCASLKDLFAVIVLMKWNGFWDFAWILIFPALGITGALFSDWLQSGRTIGRDVLSFVSLAALLLLALPSLRGQMTQNQAALFKDILNPEYQVEFEWIARDSSFYEGLKNNGAAQRMDENEKPIDAESVFEPLTDYRRRRMRPGADTVFHGKRIRINEWGMVDERSYALEKKPGVLRVAILSASVALPYGVEQGKEWPRLVEQALREKGYTAMEWMNFSTVSYSSLFSPYILETEAAKFQPDIVLGPSGEREIQMNAFNIATALRSGLPIPYQDELLPLFGLEKPDGFLARHFFMRPPHSMAMKVFKWSAERVANDSRKLGAQPVFVMLPTKVLASQHDLRGIRWDEKKMLQAIREAGFETYDLGGLFDGYSIEDVTLVDNLRAFNHFNEKGHRMIADEFLKNFEPLVKSWFEKHAERRTASVKKVIK